MAMAVCRMGYVLILSFSVNAIIVASHKLVLQPHYFSRVPEPIQFPMEAPNIILIPIKMEQLKKSLFPEITRFSCYFNSLLLKLILIFLITSIH